MNKKMLSLATVAALTAAMSTAAFAETQVVDLATPISYNSPAVMTPASLGYTGSALAITIDGLNADQADEAASYWNDWCMLTIKVEDANGVAYYPVVGGEVSWDLTVDNKGTEDDSDDIKVAIADVQFKMEKGGTNIMAKVPVSGDFTVSVISLGWEDADHADSPSAQVTSVAVLDAEVAAGGSGDVAPIAYLAAVVAVAGLAVVASKKARA